MSEASSSSSVGDLLRGLMTDVTLLLRQEVRLAQAEVSEKLEQAQSGIYAVVTGLLVAFCALLILLQAVVIALSNVLPAWAASLAVGVVLAIIAFVLIRVGSRNLRPSSLVPERTLRAGGLHEQPGHARQDAALRQRSG